MAGCHAISVVNMALCWAPYYGNASNDKPTWGARSLKLDYNNKSGVLTNGSATQQKSRQMKSIVINNMEWIESITKKKAKAKKKKKQISELNNS